MKIKIANEIKIILATPLTDLTNVAYKHPDIFSNVENFIMHEMGYDSNVRSQQVECSREWFKLPETGKDYLRTKAIKEAKHAVNITGKCIIVNFVDAKTSYDLGFIRQDALSVKIF
jgi:hypothetical protein